MFHVSVSKKNKKNVNILFRQRSFYHFLSELWAVTGFILDILRVLSESFSHLVALASGGLLI